VVSLIVGLGNPGSKYQRTRHNAGFLFLDYLHDVLGASQWQRHRQFHAEFAECYVAGKKIMLIKPQTFMNLSGDAVQAFMHFHKLSAEQLLVVHDEIDLPFGAVKFKKGGGHAGHNGLRDIIAKCGDSAFYRLRLGIGRPINGSVADFVLSAYSSDEVLVRDKVFGGVAKKIDELLSGKLNVVFD